MIVLSKSSRTIVVAAAAVKVLLNHTLLSLPFGIAQANSNKPALSNRHALVYFVLLFGFTKQTSTTPFS
jgi:hypothetical protein